MIMYLNSDAAAELDWETAEERDSKVKNHPESILMTIEEFSNAFNAEQVSDLGYTAIVDTDQKLSIAIDGESVNIYRDMGEDEEPLHVVYWHLDEVEEDPSLFTNIALSVNMHSTNQLQLLMRIRGVGAGYII